MEIKQIASDVYACLQEDRGIGCSNAGLVNCGDGLMVDTLWDLPHTRQMLALYGGVWKKPARFLVITHENGDHCWGNQLLPDAEIIASQQCAENFGTFESPELLQALKAETDNPDPGVAAFARSLGPWDFSDIELRGPTTAFASSLEIDLDGVTVRLLNVGPAHTAGDVIAHLPERDVVFAGDVVFRLCTPMGWAGSYQAWIAALDTIIAMNPETVVPGHGPLCGIEGAKDMKDYLLFVREQSRRHYDTGLPILEAAKRIELGPYAQWNEPERLMFNVERAYREFQGCGPESRPDIDTIFKGMVELRKDQQRRS